MYVYANNKLVKVTSLGQLQTIAEQIANTVHNGTRHIVVHTPEDWSVADTHTGGLYGSFNSEHEAAYICGVKNDEHRASTRKISYDLFD